MMEHEHDERNEIWWAKNKKGLVTSVMQAKFEEHIFSILCEGKYKSLDELDATIDTEIRKYFAETDMVVDYYNAKIDFLEQNS